MKRGQAFTPDGPLTLGDLRDIVTSFGGVTGHTGNDHFPHDRIVEVRTPMAPDRRQVTLTVTDERWRPPPTEQTCAETGDSTPSTLTQEN